MKNLIKELFNFKSKISASILSLIYSLLLVFGTSYRIKGNASMVFSTFFSVLFIIILFLIFRTIIILLYNYLDKYKNKENKKKNKFQLILDKYPFLISFIIILVLWIPYIICFYPTILSPDPSFQIKQFFGIPNKYSTYSVLLDPNVLITNHHPVIHTLILGGCLKIGNNIGNDNLGLFIYSIIQILILLSTLSYTIRYMTRIKTNYKYRIICILIYGLVPMFPLYAMSAVKDVIFTSFMIIYIILIYHLIKNTNMKLKIYQLFLILLLLILIMLFRNNGFHVILLSFPFLVIFNKKNMVKLLSVFLIFLMMNYSYNNILLPHFKITPSSVREVLSIPFQQTARYVTYHEKELTHKEYKTYDKILKMKTLKERYNPEKSDPVKNKFNKNTTKKELKEYFKIWFKDFKKDPVLYVDSTINNTYGYFYPFKTNWYIYHNYYDIIVNDGFNYHYNNFENSRIILGRFAEIYPFIPIVGLISNIGFNGWILFFIVSYLIYRKRYKGIIYLLPACVSLLVCVASPVNAYFRYSMPYIFSMPIIIALFINYIERSELNEKE